MDNNQIFLIGMMYSGKSTIGKHLSKKLNLHLLDLDNEIEKIMDISIDEIFRLYGENRFRLIETAFFKECSKLEKHIIVTGGGTIISKSNQLILQNKKNTFFLDVSPEKIFERFKNDSEKNKRPILNNCSINLIQDLYQQRISIYKACSKYIINTELLSEGEAVLKIQEHLNA